MHLTSRINFTLENMEFSHLFYNLIHSWLFNLYTSSFSSSFLGHNDWRDATCALLTKKRSKFLQKIKTWRWSSSRATLSSFRLFLANWRAEMQKCWPPQPKLSQWSHKRWRSMLNAIFLEWKYNKYASPWKKKQFGTMAKKSLSL